MDFKKYIHLEKFGNDEVQGIELGRNYIFPKIDGTNGCIWWGEHGLRCASRNRELTTGNDNQGFMNAMIESLNHIELCKNNPDYYFYGEWLVPHSLKTYRENAWRKFYIFDVQHKDSDKFMRLEDYEPMIEPYSVDCVLPIAVIENGTYENFLHELDNNKFLIQDGQGSGEGIVLKNYEYQNKYGCQVWAKMITTIFKDKHLKEMGAPVKKFKMIEQDIVDDAIDKHFVDKVYAKIVNECDGWSSKYIPRLLNTVFHDLVNEELWDQVKKLKNPTINFGTLQQLTVLKIKALRPELF
jgi:hypothetical protein